MDRNSARPLMEQLRDDTHALHKRAEKQQLQSKLMQGRLPKQHFIVYLEQLLLIHQRLEAHLSTAAADNAVMAHIIQPHHYHAPYLKQDLRQFGHHLQLLQARPATAAWLVWLDDTASCMPLALLGVHYVLEGSKNGGRFQAEKVREAYALAGRAGTMYLDPYGDQQLYVWAQYKTDMNHATLSQNARRHIIEAAKTTFQHFIYLCQELMASNPIAYGRPSTTQMSDEVILL